SDTQSGHISYRLPTKDIHPFRFGAGSHVSRVRHSGRNRMVCVSKIILALYYLSALTQPRAGNWDQALVNLGFTDPDRMNQDFYAMSRDPDPQCPISVFQQLLASSIPETRVSPRNSISGANGREHLRSNDEHEGIEASHILQSLSAAEDTSRS